MPLTTARFPAGAPLWVSPSTEGQVVVFQTAGSNRIIGFVQEAKLQANRP